MSLSWEGTDLSNPEVRQETSESKSKLTPMAGDRVGSGTINCLTWGGGQRSSLGGILGVCVGGGAVRVPRRAVPSQFRYHVQDGGHRKGETGCMERGEDRPD